MDHNVKTHNFYMDSEDNNNLPEVNSFNNQFSEYSQEKSSSVLHFKINNDKQNISSSMRRHIETDSNSSFS